MSVHAVIPLKDPAQGKARLATVLGAQERVGLIEAMLRRVVGALAATRRIASIGVLTGRRACVPQGCDFIDDGRLELNAAIARAVAVIRSRIAPRGAAAAATVLVVHADLPLVTAAEIADLIAAADDRTLVAAPDWGESGTNALLHPLSRSLVTRFGPRSLSAHRDAAREAGLRFLSVERPGLAHDIDEPSQLAWLVATSAEYAHLRAVMT